MDSLSDARSHFGSLRLQFFVRIRIYARCVSIFVDLFLEQVKEILGSIALVRKLTISNIYEMWLRGDDERLKLTSLRF